MDAPDVSYVKNGDVSIAYSTIGDGPFDVVFVPGWILSVFESAWDGPAAETLSTARLLLARDPVRQARDRPLRPRERHSRLRDEDGRHPRRDGRRRIRASRPARRLRGRPDDASLRGHVPGTNRRRDPLRNRGVVGARRRLPVGAYAGGVAAGDRRGLGQFRLAGMARRVPRGLLAEHRRRRGDEALVAEVGPLELEPGSPPGPPPHEHAASTSATCCPRSARPRSCCTRWTTR